MSMVLCGVFVNGVVGFLVLMYRFWSWCMVLVLFGVDVCVCWMRVLSVCVLFVMLS